MYIIISIIKCHRRRLCRGAKLASVPCLFSQETSGTTLLRFEVTRYPLQTRESFCRGKSFICQHLLNSPPSFSAHLSRPRDAGIRAHFHKIKQRIVSPFARLLTVLVRAQSSVAFVCAGPDLGGGSWVPEPPPHPPAPKMCHRLFVCCCFLYLTFPPVLVCLLFLTTSTRTDPKTTVQMLNFLGFWGLCPTDPPAWAAPGPLPNFGPPPLFLT